MVQQVGLYSRSVRGWLWIWLAGDPDLPGASQALWDLEVSDMPVFLPFTEGICTKMGSYCGIQVKVQISNAVSHIEIVV